MRASKSTGPITGEGKKRISGNAIKTGFYSTHLILPGESEEEFLNLKETLNAQLGSKNLISEYLIHDLTVLLWKRMRLLSVEHRVIQHLIEQPITQKELEPFLSINWQKDCARSILEEIDSIDETFFKESQSYKSIAESLILKNITQSEFAEIIQEDYPFKREVMSRLDQAAIKNAIVNISGFDYSEMSSFRDPALMMVLAKMVKEADLTIWAYTHRAELNEAIKKVKDRRLLKFMQDESISRAHEDLRRSFTRLLKEIRRSNHQPQVVEMTLEEIEG
jgi:hypothetical protein